jgi:hypothetical protein
MDCWPKFRIRGDGGGHFLREFKDEHETPFLDWNAEFLGLCLGFVTESNKQFIRFGVTGPILKSTTEVTWAGRERKHRAKNDVEPRVHWTLNTTHQFIIIATSMIS